MSFQTMVSIRRTGIPGNAYHQGFGENEAGTGQARNQKIGHVK